MASRLHEQGRALSRWLNAVVGDCGRPETGAGDGAVTFSAASWELARADSRFGAWRVRFVDWLWFNGAGHCEAAAAWHRLHDLIPVAAQFHAPADETRPGLAVAFMAAREAEPGEAPQPPTEPTRPRGA